MRYLDISYELWLIVVMICSVCFFFFQAEDGIRDLVRSRGLGDVYKRQFDILPSRINLTIHYSQIVKIQ